MKSLSAQERWILLASLAEGIVLGYGLETCFGIGRYRLIMGLGVLGGLGGVVVGRMVLAAKGRRAILLGILPAAASFAVWFLWRVLPLIREELKFSQ